MRNPSKTFLFTVQGEGRGHMTQSIAMQNIINQSGMEVSEVLIGTSPRRQIPDFFFQKINTHVTPIESPNFAIDSKMKSVKMGASVIKNLMNLSIFKTSLQVIDEKIKKHKPDVIINFYDPLMGLYYMLKRPKIPMICVAHQYIFHHPDFGFPQGNLIDEMSLKLYTSLTSFGARKKLALSFYPLNHYHKASIFVIPPLLREDVFQQNIQQRNYLLVYLVNSGYIEDIIAWHKKNSTVEIHCFSDRKTQYETEQFHEKLFFHRLNDQKFLAMMAEAKGLISTAGFESVCEAMYFGKPVFMVPVEGHYEQYCNSRDAFKAGAGLYDKSFNITPFLNYLANFRNKYDTFKDWVNQSSVKTLEQINSVLYP